MKNLIKLLGNLNRERSAKVYFLIVALVAVIGFSIIACDNGGDDDGSEATPTPSGSGTFTLNNIPDIYNGQYAILYGDNEDLELMGYESINFNTEFFTLPKISNGSVSIKVWNIGAMNESTLNIPRYSGNHTLDIGIFILASATVKDDFDPSSATLIFFEGAKAVKFTAGSATKSWNDGEVE
jgi:hypothetical protein